MNKFLAMLFISLFDYDNIVSVVAFLGGLIVGGEGFIASIIYTVLYWMILSIEKAIVWKYAERFCLFGNLLYGKE